MRCRSDGAAAGERAAVLEPGGSGARPAGRARSGRVYRSQGVRWRQRVEPRWLRRRRRHAVHAVHLRARRPRDGASGVEPVESRARARRGRARPAVGPTLAVDRARVLRLYMHETFPRVRRRRRPWISSWMVILVLSLAFTLLPPTVLT